MGSFFPEPGPVVVVGTLVVVVVVPDVVVGGPVAAAPAGPSADAVELGAVVAVAVPVVAMLCRI